MNKMMLNIAVFFLILFLISSCKDPTVNFDEGSYKPKIVIDGYIFPGNKVENIKITRNFPLNTTIDSGALIIKDANVRILEIEKNTEYPLTYNPDSKAYENITGNLIIDYEKKYKLLVEAVIDGKKISANSTTTVPAKGFKIDRSSSNLSSLFYRERDEGGNLKHFKVTFNPSPGTEFYVISATAMQASLKSFIYTNPFAHFLDSTQIQKNLNLFKYQYMWLQNVSISGTVFDQDIDWLSIWFYGEYQIIAYAGDQNFKDFLLTHDFVQEMDGNLHEPRFHIDGDGIGVFGSAIADTVYLTVKR
jgi:hypothetical protein